MVKITVREKELLNSITAKIIAKAEHGTPYQLTNKESKLFRKLAMYYDIDPNSIKNYWKDSFPDMNDEEAYVTMSQAFGGLDKRIRKSYITVDSRIKEV